MKTRCTTAFLVLTLTLLGCGESEAAACDDFLLLQDIAVQAERDGIASEAFLTEHKALNSEIMVAMGSDNIDAVPDITKRREALTKAQPWFDDVCAQLG